MFLSQKSNFGIQLSCTGDKMDEGLKKFYKLYPETYKKHGSNNVFVNGDGI